VADASLGIPVYAVHGINRAEREARMRVLLADDQVKVRFALRVLLERQPDVAVVGEASDARELADQLTATCPDALLLDWELPGLAATRVLAALLRGFPELTVIALSGRSEARREAEMAGASAFVSKTDPPECLLAVMRATWQASCGRKPGHAATGSRSDT
jgi:DNA-binding NarL/FixJ family response regulator